VVQENGAGIRERSIELQKEKEREKGE